MKSFLKEENRKTQAASLWRTLSALQDSRSHRLKSNGHELLNFSSNDYLGYSRHPAVVAAAQDAVKKYGAGGRSSRLIAGSLEIHHELEAELARFKRTEAALVFPSGFMANLGVISSLAGPGDAVILDRLSHASLIDAAKLSRARVLVYEHASTASLEKVLARARNFTRRLVVTDSLFSMDGDLAPLKSIVDLTRKYSAWLMIDDAHATGVLGETGIGLAEEADVLDQVDIVMGTLSKALGSQGGFVCGSKDLIEFLVNRARSFIYTTALAPACAASALAALKLVQKDPEPRLKLLSLSRNLRSRLRERFPEQAPPFGADTPIVPFHTGSAKNTLAHAEKLKDAGIYAPAIRPPTVPKDECRLRFSLTAEHSEADVNQLLSALDQATS